MKQKTKKQTSEKKELWQDLLDREQNFHDGKEFFSQDDKYFLESIEGLYLTLEADIESAPVDAGKRLDLIYSRTYDFVVTFNRNFSVFGKNTALYEAVFDVCEFMGICMFLHNKKEIPTLSRTDYIFDYAPQKYGIDWFPDEDKANKNYINRKNCGIEHEDMAPVRKTNANMRAYVSRKHSTRLGYTPNKEWSAIRKDMIQEWRLFFDYVAPKGSADKNLRKTLKDIGNLYQDVTEAIKFPMDDEYGKRLEEAYKDFSSKLSKIKYENYLELCRFFLEHIKAKENLDYYGINLYRFEKLFGLYEIVDKVNRLLSSKDESERDEVLLDAIIMNGICFPKVRTGLCRYIEYLREDDIFLFTRIFFDFLTTFIKLSRLLVDKFIDDDALGKDWELLFLEKSNSMAANVLYDPATIDYSIDQRSQEMFESLLSAPVSNLVCNHLARWSNIRDFT